MRKNNDTKKNKKKKIKIKLNQKKVNRQKELIKKHEKEIKTEIQNQN